LEKTIKLKIDGSTNHTEITSGLRSCLKDLFSGCRVNFLFGAGFSAGILGLLDNNELFFEAIRQYRGANATDNQKAKILEAYLYWDFFVRCIYPIVEKISTSDFSQYNNFGSILNRIFSERSNPVLDRQCNIFTTNYDPILERVFDNSTSICNDGFEGRISPKFSTDNFTKSYYRQAVFSNRKSEIPSVNVVKLHGSVTWGWDIFDGGIIYQNYISVIKGFHQQYKTLFNDAILSSVTAALTANNSNDAAVQVSGIIACTLLDALIVDIANYEKMLFSYKCTFLIVNPTKEKFSDTLLNKNYYELLRIFSNELEKENTLLVVNGFSFRDEHILDLTRRSMLNPSLKVLLFCYDEDNIREYESLFTQTKNNNITYVAIEKDKLDLEHFNEILSCVHI